MRNTILVILFAGCLAGMATAADPLDTWYWRNPSPQGNPLNGVCFGADEFVAVGVSGTVMTSPDGAAWLNQSSGTRINLQGVTHGGGRYVAIGDYGLILYSDDARTWHEADSPWFYHLNEVTWGNGLFVAVGEDTAILTSPDGVTWTLRATGAEELVSVAFRNGTFVAGGGNPPPKMFNQPTGPVTQIVLRSNNGLNWLPITLGIEGAVTAVDAAAGQLFVAISQRESNFLFTSSDGSNWTLETSFPAYGISIAAIADDGVTARAVFSSAPSYVQGSLVSPDGTDWMFDESAFLSSRSDLVVGAGRFVSVGNSQDISATGLEGIAIKVGDDAWTSASVEQDTPGLMVFGNDLAVGLETKWSTNGTVAGIFADSSTNGVTWESHPVTSDGSRPFSNLSFGNQRFLAWGDNGILAHSLDAIDWTVTTNEFNPPIYYQSKTMVAGNGVYLWVQEGEISQLSTDLTTWEPVTMPAVVPMYPPGKVALFGNGSFILRDEERGGIQRSSECKNWEFHAVPNLPKMLGFYQDRFLGWRDGLVTSSNAVDWQKVGNTPNIESFFDAVYADGLYLIYGIGWTQTSPGLVLATRDDGATWTTHHPPGNQPFWSAVIAFNSVMFSGNYGVLIQSAPLADAAPKILQPILSTAVQPGEPLGLLGDTYGSLPLTFEWYRDDVLIQNATEALLSLPNLPEGSNHEYSLVVSNAEGSVTNGPARVVVGRPAVLGIAGGPSVNGSLSGSVGLTYRVDFQDGSPAGETWQTLTNLTLTGSAGVFTDTPPTNRFYRAELVP